MLSCVKIIIKDLWLKSANRKSLIFLDKFIFYILCFFEYFYKIGFFFVQSIKKYKGQKSVPGCKIISVGNLSVGGTGKTVFIEFLANFLNVEKCAVVSRGYGSSVKNNLLVCDGNNIFYTPDVCGDEPFMIAQTLKIVTATGSDRFRSCKIVCELSDKIKYILLDDGYQNYQLKKDIDILIIDARFPLGFNGHCLPAGNLRECDYSRADLIVLSHADLVSTEQINEIKKIFCKFEEDRILLGKHEPLGVFQAGNTLMQSEYFDDKKFIAVAGIGSFSGFEQSVKNFGINIVSCFEFDDHHRYLPEDINKIMQTLQTNALDGIVVTQKDWVKLSQIISEEDRSKFFVFKIKFEFLFQSQYSLFNHFLSSKLS